MYACRSNRDSRCDAETLTAGQLAHEAVVPPTQRCPPKRHVCWAVPRERGRSGCHGSVRSQHGTARQRTACWSLTLRRRPASGHSVRQATRTAPQTPRCATRSLPEGLPRDYLVIPLRLPPRCSRPRPTAPAPTDASCLWCAVLREAAGSGEEPVLASNDASERCRLRRTP